MRLLAIVLLAVLVGCAEAPRPTGVEAPPPPPPPILVWEGYVSLGSSWHCAAVVKDNVSGRRFLVVYGGSDSGHAVVLIPDKEAK